MILYTHHYTTPIRHEPAPDPFSLPLLLLLFPEVVPALALARGHAYALELELRVELLDAHFGGGEHRLGAEEALWVLVHAHGCVVHDLADVVDEVLGHEVPALVQLDVHPLEVHVHERGLLHYLLLHLVVDGQVDDLLRVRLVDDFHCAVGCCLHLDRRMDNLHLSGWWWSKDRRRRAEVVVVLLL